MPDFKPNNQRTKTFWQRLEYGSNIQTAKNNFFPTTTDFGLSVGYKLNDKNTIGIGRISNTSTSPARAWACSRTST